MTRGEKLNRCAVPRWGLAVAMVLPLGLVGCGGQDEGTTPPVATVSSTVSSGTATPSASVTPSLDPSQDPLYLEAVEVYKKFAAENFKVEQAGGAKEIPPAIRPYVADNYERELAATYVEWLDFDVLAAPGVGPAVSVAPNPGVSRSKSVVAIQACLDGREVELRTRAGKVLGKAGIVHESLFFSRQGPHLVIVEGDSKEVKKCPFAS